MSRGLKLYTKIDSKSWPDEKSGRFKHCGADQGLKKVGQKSAILCEYAERTFRGRETWF